ncbi:hypothetical protein BJ980_002307 [Nocardioides daedukensis]|uniref:Uncharacterized protein n=1 Tax=Nocardioides daedukensis TaxID=634462 RepID=A0A7Y9UTX0_9ACTN|nr:zinc metallochaperone AztD [Nocardioides daedukensis]NYG59384.1 hypothetical protein [Nocardioides daedukensis]
MRTIPITLAAFLLLTGCGQDTDDEAEPKKRPVTSTEVAAPEPRVAVTHDGGVIVLDAEKGTVLLEHELEGFTRINQAGDGRHAFLSTAKGWEALDLGAWTDAHSDHGHSFVTEPRMTGTVVPADEPGHVVAHGKRTVLYDDATGTYVAFDPHDLEDGDPELTTRRVEVAHHGVAVEREDGNLIHTVGTPDGGNGVRLVTPAGNELAATNECPGVHGEAFTADQVAVFGCEDGAVIVEGRTLTKVQSPDPYGRIGNQAGSEASPVLLGDYKTEKDAELERPTRISLIDTRTAKIRLVDLPASYTFRSLGRGPDGEGLVLGTDGRLRVIDVESGKVTDAIEVTRAWREPIDWQQPRPALHVQGGTAYVTEPATKQIHLVDLVTGKVRASHQLDVVPNEITATPTG